MNFTKYTEMFRDDLSLKRYSHNTIKNYVSAIELFLKDHSKYDSPVRISESEIKQWMGKAKTRNSIAHRLSALKLFYKMTLKQSMKLRHIEYPRKENKLPKVMDKETILKAISGIKNKKHKAIITLAFSTGMRVSEICNLKVKDIDSKRMLIRVEGGKGNKDRYVPLSQNTLLTLRDYAKDIALKEYVFEGQFGGAYSPRSCNQIVKKYIDRDMHFHTLRHSCFTTLLETGTDIRVIQEIAGHSNPKTTQIYTHVSKTTLNKVNLPC